MAAVRSCTCLRSNPSRTEHPHPEFVAGYIGRSAHSASSLSVLEDEVTGEKIVTRHILEQTRRNSDDLVTIKSRLKRVKRKFDSLERKVDGINQELKSLSRSIRGIDSDAVRAVERQRREGA